MDNFESDVEVTEEPRMSIRQAIHESLQKQGLEESDPTPAIVKQAQEEEVKNAEGTEEVEEAPESQEAQEVVEEAQAPVEAPPVDRIPLVPPADMNKFEKDAFLNPTPENAHILQQYMNRRAYETRSDYQRKMHEVEELRKQTSSVYDVIKQYEQDYAKHGISVGDVAKRSIAWDKAMQTNPVETALEWLDSYGLSLEDLKGQATPASLEPNAGYLTRQEAERIAEERARALFEQQQQEQHQSAVAYYNERVVNSFVSAKPLFRDPETASQLEAEMAPIVSALSSTGKYSSPEEILETAYNYVVAGNPTFSSLHQAMIAKPVIEQKQAAAQKAKAASKSISGSAGSGTPRMQIKSLRDNLRHRLGHD